MARKPLEVTIHEFCASCVKVTEHVYMGGEYALCTVCYQPFPIDNASHQSFMKIIKAER